MRNVFLCGLRGCASSCLLLLTLLLSACLGMPEKVTPVENFALEPYLGKWYEVARLDHSFERGLTQVQVNYTLREDGGVAVENTGYNAEHDEWEVATGKAYFVDREDQGYFKVSFFGPFYSSYVIFALDEDYQYAFVSGSDTDYLWLLSRTPTISAEVMAAFQDKSENLGFGLKELIWVEQDAEPLLAEEQ